MSFYAIPVTTGAVPIVVTVLGVAGLVWLLVVRSRRHVLLAVPLALVLAVGLTLLAYWLVEKVWRPFPEPLDRRIWYSVGVGLFAVVLLVPRLRVSHGFISRALSVLATLVVVLAAGAQVNVQFDEYPTLGALLGRAPANQTELADVPRGTTVPLASWSPVPGAPTQGEIVTVALPGKVSKFEARDADVYLPPAYLATPRPLLPVLVLLSGQPGTPQDWVTAGRVTQTMDAYAAKHRGLAPVVVMADGTGSLLGNPLCADTPLGNAATYLTRDVPDDVKSLFEVDPDPARWAVGGLSYGGTCALQLATTAPQVYPTFMDYSGELEPTLGDHPGTVEQAFGGSEAAFQAINPLTLMQKRQYPKTAGSFVVGADDASFAPGIATLEAAARAAGMDVRYAVLPGGHSFQLWSDALAHDVDWLGARLGLSS